MDKSDEFLDSNQEQEASRIAQLIAAHLQVRLTPRQEQEINEWLEESEENVLLFEKMTEAGSLEKAMILYQSFDSQRAYRKLKKRIKGENAKPHTLWKPFAAAAIVIGLGVGIYLFTIPNKSVGTSQPTVTVKADDIYPMKQAVKLTLSDGTIQIIEDDSIRNFAEGNSTARFNRAGLKYQTTGTSDSAPVYNMLSVPAGTTYHLILSDGTNVWLNAQSSIRYPVSFGRGERNVSVTGEAYFEITHGSSSQQFIVTMNNSKGEEREKVEVLGTHFNVRGYDDEHVRTALLEGKIIVHNTILKPGEEASIENGEIKVAGFNAEEVLSWKNGIFYFNDETVSSILSQVEKWYNVKIEYKDKIDYHFNAEIPRDVPVSRLLKILELTNKIHFKTIAEAKEGRAGTIIVTK